MPFALKADNGLWVSRTCRFGAFHGSVRLTPNKKDARLWTRRGDAEHAVRTANYRFQDRWTNWKPYEIKHYGVRTFVLEELK